MILVDTSVWIDHLREEVPQLTTALLNDEVGSHPFVTEELSLGSIRNRNDIIAMLGNLFIFPTINHIEFMTFVESQRLWGHGLSAIDVHILGSVAIAEGSTLWTRDKRLLTKAKELSIPTIDDW